MEKINRVEAKAILKKAGISVVCRSLTEVKTKKLQESDKYQMFCETWCGVGLTYFVFNLQENTVRKGNYFNVEGKTRFGFYKEPAIDISKFVQH